MKAVDDAAAQVIADAAAAVVAEQYTAAEADGAVADGFLAAAEAAAGAALV